jgi:hypothetical protein
MVPGSSSSIDVKNLTSDEGRTIEVEHRLYNVRHLSHPSIGWSAASA